MIEIGDGASFGQIRLGVFRILHQSGVRDFDGNVAVKFLVAGKVDSTEPASAQQPFDAIASHLEWIRFRLTTVRGRGFPLLVLLRYIFWVGLIHTCRFIYSETPDRDVTSRTRRLRVKAGLIGQRYKLVQPNTFRTPAPRSASHVHPV